MPIITQQFVQPLKKEIQNQPLKVKISYFIKMTLSLEQVKHRAFNCEENLDVKDFLGLYFEKHQTANSTIRIASTSSEMLLLINITIGWWCENEDCLRTFLSHFLEDSIWIDSEISESLGCPQLWQACAPTTVTPTLKCHNSRPYTHLIIIHVFLLFLNFMFVIHHLGS